MKKFIIRNFIWIAIGTLTAVGIIHFYMDRHSRYGIASHYDRKLHGKPTASGERYDKNKLTAAHRTLPFGTRIRLTNLENGRGVVVRINDRGPGIKGRIIDLSHAAARRLGIIDKGTARVKIEEIVQPV